MSVLSRFLLESSSGSSASTTWTFTSLDCTLSALFDSSSPPPLWHLVLIAVGPSLIVVPMCVLLAWLLVPYVTCHGDGDFYSLFDLFSGGLFGAHRLLPWLTVILKS